MELQKKFKLLSQGARSHSRLYGWLNLIQGQIENKENFIIATLNRERSQTIICELKRRKLTFTYKFTRMGVLINEKLNDAN